MSAEETLNLIAKQWCTLEDIMKLGHLGRNSALKAKKKIILAINKKDSIKKENILRIIEEYNKYIDSIGGSFKDIIPISVYKNDGLDILVKCKY